MKRTRLSVCRRKVRYATHEEAMAAMDAEIDAIELQRAGSARRKGA